MQLRAAGALAATLTARLLLPWLLLTALLLGGLLALLQLFQAPLQLLGFPAQNLLLPALREVGNLLALPLLGQLFLALGEFTKL